MQFKADVSESALIPAELEAIAAAIRDSAVPKPRRKTQTSASALSAELRSPLEAWATELVTELRYRLRAFAPEPWQLALTRPQSAERAAPVPGWRGMTTCDGVPAVWLEASSELVEQLAALRCGVALGEAEPRRKLTEAARRLFAPAGQALLASAVAAWARCGLGELTPIADPGAGEALVGGAVRLVLTWTGHLRGRCDVVLAAPAMTALTTRHHRASAELAHQLEGVELEVVVELGRCQVERGHLVPGAELALDTRLGGRVPIFVGGVRKAWGLPVVEHGLLAIHVQELEWPEDRDGGQP